MKKLIRDGKVAVLVSPGFGSGWYSWHHIPELLFDPDVVKMIELDWPRERIIAHCEKLYGDIHFYGGVNELKIVWVPQGIKFRIDEYDGAETLQIESDIEWFTA